MDPLTTEIESLMARCQTPLLHYAAGILHNRDLAQDVVQEAFIRYARQRQQEGQIENPKAWLYRVAHNLALDLVRRQQRDSAARAELGADPHGHLSDGPDALTEHQEARRKALAMVGELSEREQQIVMLKVMQRKSYKEIAEIMGLTTTNVGFILHTTFKKLSRRWQEAPG